MLKVAVAASAAAIDKAGALEIGDQLTDFARHSNSIEMILPKSSVTSVGDSKS